MNRINKLYKSYINALNEGQGKTIELSEAVNAASLNVQQRAKDFSDDADALAYASATVAV